METLKDGRICCRARVQGVYRGKPFDYTEPEGEDGSYYLLPDGDPSTFWWADGNMSCDCNRGRFVGENIEECGEDILIDTVSPVEFEGPILRLNESHGRGGNK